MLVAVGDPQAEILVLAIEVWERPQLVHAALEPALSIFTVVRADRPSTGLPSVREYEDTLSHLFRFLVITS